ncbi:MAG: VOC family protein [Flavobacteriales bacterium]|nr:VOC family protein [Flavobacteriales bacterium]
MSAKPLKIDFLDHVAIRVKSLSRSAEWYEMVLGLQRYEIPEWGAYPIFMLSGRSGVALFPAQLDHPKLDTHSRNVRIDHFAFHVDRANYELAKERFTQSGIHFKEHDHIYFNSIYLHDPDGHEVELTTLQVSPERFYKTDEGH